ncbi:chromate transporter, partial [Mediterraneibacter gnavus]
VCSSDLLKIDSFYGAIVATLGCILPSCINVPLIAYIYLKYQQMSIIQNILKYIRPAVVSLIAVSGLLIIV